MSNFINQVFFQAFIELEEIQVYKLHMYFLSAFCTSAKNEKNYNNQKIYNFIFFDNH